MATNGLVLIKPSTIAKTGASSTATIEPNGSVSFDLCETLSLNDVFSSTYDNYVIDLRGTSSTGTNIFLKFRVGGADNSTASSYTTQGIDASSTSVTGSRSATTFGAIAVFNATQRCGFNTYVYGPNLVQPTAWRTVAAGDLSGARLTDYAGTHNQSTAYDGITLIVNSGTSTGLIKVYGLVQ